MDESAAGVNLVIGNSVLALCFVGLALEVKLIVFLKWPEMEWTGRKRER